MCNVNKKQSENNNIEMLLAKWQSGDPHAKEGLFQTLYNELSAISAALLNKERAVSLATGDLVNEAAIRIIRLDKIDWQSKAHFLALSSKVMRQVLIDHARKKQSQKRHHYKVTLLTSIADEPTQSLDLQMLEEALDELSLVDPQRVKVVEMRYYGGLSIEQISAVLGVSESTVKRNWRASRAWLLNYITEKLREF